VPTLVNSFHVILEMENVVATDPNVHQLTVTGENGLHGLLAQSLVEMELKQRFVRSTEPLKMEELNVLDRQEKHEQDVIQHVVLSIVL